MIRKKNLTYLLAIFLIQFSNFGSLIAAETIIDQRGVVDPEISLPKYVPIGADDDVFFVPAPPTAGLAEGKIKIVETIRRTNFFGRDFTGINKSTGIGYLIRNVSGADAVFEISGANARFLKPGAVSVGAAEYGCFYVTPTGELRAFMPRFNVDKSLDIPEPVTQVSSSPASGQVHILGVSGTVYRAYIYGINFPDKKHWWETADWYGKLSKISVDAYGTLYGINAQGEVFGPKEYQRDKLEGVGWGKISDIEAKDVAVGGLGSAYLLSKNKNGLGQKVFRRTRSGWADMGYYGEYISADRTGDIWVTVSDQNLMTPDIAIYSGKSGDPIDPHIYQQLKDQLATLEEAEANDFNTVHFPESPYIDTVIRLEHEVKALEEFTRYLSDHGEARAAYHVGMVGFLITTVASTRGGIMTAFVGGMGTLMAIYYSNYLVKNWIYESTNKLKELQANLDVAKSYQADFLFWYDREQQEEGGVPIFSNFPSISCTSSGSRFLGTSKTCSYSTSENDPAPPFCQTFEHWSSGSVSCY